MKKITVLVLMLAFLSSCGDKKKSEDEYNVNPSADASKTTDASSYDPKRGEGKFDKVDLGASLDQTMATNGQKVAEVKCTSCHKTTDEKLVGPGWKGVTQRRTPQWILNFATNPDPMIDKDPEVQAQLEICLVRMPNQGLKDDEARSVLEYMRKIDGVK